MLDFEVQRCTRRCAATDRELQPGEAFVSVLVPREGQIARQDFAVEAWQGPPKDAIGWWHARMPDPQAHRVDWAPSDVILHYFQQLLEQDGEADMLYVLTLLMIRRRLLRLEETEVAGDGQETMILFCPKNEAEYRVPVSQPTAERVTAIQTRLTQLLFAEPSP